MTSEHTDDTLLEEALQAGMACLPRVEPDASRITRIGGFELPGHAILAPMAGVCYQPFRYICRKSGASLVFAEFVSSDGLTRKNRRTERMLAFGDEERPFGIQVFGSDPAVIAEAVSIVEDADVDIIDLNFGCPVKKVVRREAGSALLRNPELLGQIVRAAADAVTSKPLTAKIRSGWDEINAVEIARICEDNGAQAIAVHARTQKMGYSGKADWDVIRDVKNAVSIPVFGNGDIFQPEDAFRMIDHTGCDMVMIGRGAQRCPWIFAGINAIARGMEVPIPSWSDRLELALAQLVMLTRLKTPPIAVRQFRAHLGFATRSMPGAATFRREVMVINEAEGVIERVRERAEQLRDVPFSTVDPGPQLDPEETRECA